MLVIASAEGWKSATVFHENSSRSEATDLDMKEAGGLKKYLKYHSQLITNILCCSWILKKTP